MADAFGPRDRTMNYLPGYEPPSTPYGPLQRRLLGIAGLLAVLMIGLIVFHALHTGDSGLNAVAEAAERTVKQPGGKLAMEVTYTVEGLPGQTAPKSVIGNGGGSYNARTGRTLATLTVPSSTGGSVTIESVGDERQIFMRSASFAGELPPGKEWLGMEPFLGHNPETALGANGGAKSQLEILKTVTGGVEKLDQQTVRGHLTTRYKTSIVFARTAQVFSEKGETSLAQEYEKLAEKIPASIPVEVWIDENGLARQVRMIEPLPIATGGPTVTMDMRIQFYAFGTHPKIKFPPKHKVLDYTPVLRAELGMEDGSTLGSLTPPAGAKPLSAAAFRGQVRAICRRSYGEAETLFRKSGGLIDAIKGADQRAEAKRLIQEFGKRVGQAAYRKQVRALREIAALAPPSNLARDYQRYLLLNAKEAEWDLAQTRAAELGALKLPSLAAREAQDKKEKSERRNLASELGIPSCEKKLGSDGGAHSAGTSVE